MNELLIMGGLFGLLALACAFEELIAHRWAILAWLDRKLTPIHAACFAYRRERARVRRGYGAGRR